MTELPSALQEGLAGRYTIGALLGEGGMAVVYLATDLQHDRQVAFKVMKPELAAGLGRERFLREIATTAGLEHPHILPLFDSGEVEGWLFYVMPYVTGESLRDRLERETVLPLEDAVRLGGEICSAVHHASERGIVHRDLKPENILLSDGHARVADFGIAAALGSAGGDRLTDSGSFVGTMEYMSPEQATGSPVDSRSDLYAVAAIMYEMLTGEPPFSGPNPTAVLAKKVTEEIPRVSLLRSTVSPDLEDVVTRGLARLPADRFKTLREFGEALGRAQIGGTTQGRTVTQPGEPVRRGKGLRALGIIAAAVAATVLLFTAGVLDWRPFAASTEDQRLAVLPFANEMGDTAQEFLVGGLHEALIGQLSRRSLLSVIARTSVMPYRGTDKPVAVIAGELDADVLVSGAVSASGDTVILSIEVIDPTTRTTRLTERYRRLASELAVLPEEIARQVSSVLGAESGQGAPTVELHQVDQAALTAFLRAQFHANRGTLPDLELAIGYLEEAIAADSEFAAPHSLMALFHSNSAFLGVDPHVAFELAKASARRALQLDPNLPDAHLYLAYVLASHEWDWPNAEAEFREALRLSPSFAYGHGLFGTFLAWLGRGDEALEHARRAVELDPVSLYAATQLAGVSYLAGNYAEAAVQAEEVIRSAPEFVLAHDWLAWSRDALGESDPAVVAAEEAVRLSGRDSRRLSTLARVYIGAGRVDDARSLLSELQEMEEEGTAPPITLASVYAALGQADDALQWLELAYRMRDPVMVPIRNDHRWDPIRSDPRFQRLVQRLNFPG